MNVMAWKGFPLYWSSARRIPSHGVCNTRLWCLVCCQLEKTVEQTVDLALIHDAPVILTFLLSGGEHGVRPPVDTFPPPHSTTWECGGRAGNRTPRTCAIQPGRVWGALEAALMVALWGEISWVYCMQYCDFVRRNHQIGIFFDSKIINTKHWAL